MKHFRFRYRVNGGHTDVTVFVANVLENSPELTHANCGSLVMANDEWQALKRILELGGGPEMVAVDFIERT